MDCFFKNVSVLFNIKITIINTCIVLNVKNDFFKKLMPISCNKFVNVLIGT